MSVAQALGLGAWLLVIAWLGLVLSRREQAAGWSLAGAGVLLLGAGPIVYRLGDPPVRVTGLMMVGAGVFFTAFGLIQAL